MHFLPCSFLLSYFLSFFLFFSLALFFVPIALFFFLSFSSSFFLCLSLPAPFIFLSTKWGSCTRWLRPARMRREVGRASRCWRMNRTRRRGERRDNSRTRSTIWRGRVSRDTFVYLLDFFRNTTAVHSAKANRVLELPHSRCLRCLLYVVRNVDVFGNSKSPASNTFLHSYILYYLKYCTVSNRCPVARRQRSHEWPHELIRARSAREPLLWMSWINHCNDSVWLTVWCLCSVVKSQGLWNISPQRERWLFTKKPGILIRTVAPVSNHILVWKNEFQLYIMYTINVVSDVDFSLVLFILAYFPAVVTVSCWLSFVFARAL